MAVVLVFFVCWTPFHAQRLMFVIVTLQGEWNPTNTMTHHYLYLFSGKYMYKYSSPPPQMSGPGVLCKHEKKQKMLNLAFH